MNYRVRITYELAETFTDPQRAEDAKERSMAHLHNGCTEADWKTIDGQVEEVA